MQRKGEGSSGCYHPPVRIPLRLPPPGGRPFDVVGFGENSVDLLLVTDGYPERNTKQRVRRYMEQPGGQVATAMVACARLGWRARYIGRVGDDRHAAIGLNSLREAGVDTTAVQVAAGAASRLAFILVDASTGSRTVLWSRDDRLAMLPGEVPVEAVRSGRVLHVDASDPEAAEAAARVAHAEGIRTTVDVEQVTPFTSALLGCIDVVIAAASFPTAFTGYMPVGRALAALADAFPRAIVCVTLGEEGSLARCEGREIRTPAFPVHAIDSTGAGDVFRAGFIAGWLKDGDDAEIEEVLRYANAAAALKCRGLGARAAIPRAAEVEALLAQAG